MCAPGLVRRLEAHAIEPCLDGVPGVLEGLGIVLQVVREGGAEEEGVELEGELRRVELTVDVPLVLGHADRGLQALHPCLHGCRHAVAYDPRTAVELERRGGEEAAARKDATPHVRQPRAAQRY